MRKALQIRMQDERGWLQRLGDWYCLGDGFCHDRWTASGELVSKQRDCLEEKRFSPFGYEYDTSWDPLGRINGMTFLHLVTQNNSTTECSSLWKYHLHGKVGYREGTWNTLWAFWKHGMQLVWSAEALNRKPMRAAVPIPGLSAVYHEKDWPKTSLCSWISDFEEELHGLQ